MYSVLIIYIIHVTDEFGTGALDLDHQDQIGLQTSTVFEKKLNRFSCTRFKQGGGGRVGCRGGRHLFFANAKKKKRPSLVSLNDLLTYSFHQYEVPAVLYKICFLTHLQKLRHTTGGLIETNSYHFSFMSSHIISCVFLFQTYIDLFSKITQTQLAAVLIAVICIVILYLTKEYVNPKVKARIKMPVPIELIVVSTAYKPLSLVLTLYPKISCKKIFEY